MCSHTYTVMFCCLVFWIHDHHDLCPNSPTLNLHVWLNFHFQYYYSVCSHEGNEPLFDLSWNIILPVCHPLPAWKRLIAKPFLFTSSFIILSSFGFSLVSLCWRLILILLNSGVLLFIKITLNIVFRISSWLHFPESWQSCIPPSAESQFSFNIMEFHFFVTSVCCGHLTVARYWRPTICPLFLQPLSLASCCR